MKKTLKCIVAAALCFACFAMCAFAADSTSLADDLKEIGMFKGTNEGYELDRAPTRVEAAVMLVRMLGKEEAAEDQLAKRRDLRGQV